MRVELSRRRRRPRKKRPARACDLAVLSYPPDDNGPTEPYGPFTEQGAQAVFLREGRKGRRVQIVRYMAARALFEVVP
jgi:hypothetical protein